MSGVAFITAKKAINGQLIECFFMGSVQTDGMIYFNDERMYRCSQDGSNQQIWYTSKNNWITTNVFSEISIIAFDANSILNNISNLLGGGGAANPHASVETAVKWLINKANSTYITYSQTNRNLGKPDETSYDCSSFVITGFQQGGFSLSGATYTGDMRSAFTAEGFQWIPGSYFAASDCIRGDILLNEALHTQVYIGNNQDVNCGSTPARVQEHAPNNYGNSWNGILRYTG